MADSKLDTMRGHGACHCGAVRFAFNAPKMITVYECTCSICTKSGYLHLIVECEDFQLLSGGDELSEYCFNTNTAKHLFCKICGVKSFYQPRSHPNAYSINLRCVDQTPFDDIRIETFDGQNWEASIGEIV